MGSLIGVHSGLVDVWRANLFTAVARNRRLSPLRSPLRRSAAAPHRLLDPRTLEHNPVDLLVPSAPPGTWRSSLGLAGTLAPADVASSTAPSPPPRPWRALGTRTGGWPAEASRHVGGVTPPDRTGPACRRPSATEARAGEQAARTARTICDRTATGSSA